MTSFASLPLGREYWTAQIPGLCRPASAVAGGESFVEVLVCRECGRQIIASAALRLCSKCERGQRQ